MSTKANIGNDNGFKESAHLSRHEDQDDADVEG